jgi:uncharacterized protein with NAD-binding domain and iron-sulfur cluster
MRKKSVMVCGAGIAGMSAAHELSKAGYNVHVYEYANTCGGQARSSRKPDGFPVEYSWRGYGQFYKNVYEIMKSIPSPMCNDKGIVNTSLTVYDTELSKPVQFILVRNDHHQNIKTIVENAENWTNTISTIEWLHLQTQFYRELTSDSRIKEYAKINAGEWLSSRLSPDNLIKVTSIFGPWVGITPDRLSLHHCMNFFRMIKYPDLNKPYSHMTYTGCSSQNLNIFSHSNSHNWWQQGSGSQWSVLKRPTNEAWFDPWMTYLRDTCDVQFHFGSNIIKVCSRDGKISHINVIKNHRVSYVECDYYILAVTPFAVEEIVKNSDEQVRSDPQLKLFKGLIQDGPHIQVSFFIGFAEKIKTRESTKTVYGVDNHHIAYILPDSEFNLTLYFQDDVWYDDVYLGPNIKSLISGTACVSYVPGKLYGKPLTHLTKEEFKHEILHQLFNSIDLSRVIAEHNKGKKLSEFSIVRFEVWDGWIFPSQKTQTLSQLPNERKWVNSTNTNPYMPSIETSFRNLFLAGAHVKSSVDLYSMETACATGREAAFRIIKNGKEYLTIDKPIWVNVLSVIDNIIYNARLPQIIDSIIIIIVVLILWISIRKSG